MTAFSTTVRNSFAIFGPEPTEKWSTTSTTAVAIIWGSDKWAYGTVGLPIAFYKGIPNSNAVTNTVIIQPTKWLANSQIITNAGGVIYTKGIPNTQTITNAGGVKFYKGIPNTQTITNTGGVIYTKGIPNAYTLADTINGITFYKYIDVPMPMTANISRAFSMTIYNSMLLYGAQPTERWSESSTTSLAMIWGTDYWAYGSAGIPVILYRGFSNDIAVTNTGGVIYTKGISNAQSITDSIAGLSVGKYVSNNLVTTISVSRCQTIQINNDQSVTNVLGKEITKRYYNSQYLTNNLAVGCGYGRNINNSIYADVGVAPYAYIDNYSIIYGGYSNTINWPRPGAYSLASTPTNVWTQPTGATTTWS